MHCTQKHPAPAQPLPHNTTCSTRCALHTEASSSCTTFTSQYNLLHTSCTAHRSTQLLHYLYLTIQLAPHVVHCTQKHPAPAQPLPHNTICSTRRALHTGIQLLHYLYLTIQLAPHAVHCTHASSSRTTSTSQYNLLHTSCTAHRHPAQATAHPPTPSTHCLTPSPFTPDTHPKPWHQQGKKSN